VGLTKTELFTETQNELAAYFKVFAHPARIAIVEHLLSANVCINSDLVEELGLAQATISQHLRELKSAGIIQGTIEGTSMSYCINPMTWRKVELIFGNLFRRYIQQKPNCC